MPQRRAYHFTSPAGTFCTNSASKVIDTSSPTTTPPASVKAFQTSPKSFRLIFAVAETPALTLPQGSLTGGVGPSTSKVTARVTPRTFDIIKCRTLKCAAEWAGSICHWVGLGAWDVPVSAAFMVAPPRVRYATQRVSFRKQLGPKDHSGEHGVSACARARSNRRDSCRNSFAGR